MSPLLTAYDDHLYNLEKELKSTELAHIEIHHLNDHIKELANENELISDKLEVKMREFAKLVSDTIKNSDVMQNFEEQRMEMDKRNALLSEENQILFEQVQMLKSHYEDFTGKGQEAQEKVLAFDQLHQDHQELLHQFQELLRQKEFTESQLVERSTLLGTIEEHRKGEVRELTMLKDDKLVMLKDLDFFKAQSDKLSLSLRHQGDEIEHKLREARSKDLDKQESVLRLTSDLERSSDEANKLKHHLRIAKSDISALSKIRDELQH